MLLGLGLPLALALPAMEASSETEAVAEAEVCDDGDDDGDPVPEGEDEPEAELDGGGDVCVTVGALLGLDAGALDAGALDAGALGAGALGARTLDTGALGAGALGEAELEEADGEGVRVGVGVGEGVLAAGSAAHLLAVAALALLEAPGLGEAAASRTVAAWAAPGQPASPPRVRRPPASTLSTAARTCARRMKTALSTLLIWVTVCSSWYSEATR